MTSYKIGITSETRAKWYLRLRGYKILEQRYITGRGTNCAEIDIIASRKNTLVFVEVKHRKTTSDALLSITQTQQRRLFHAAEIYRAKNKKYQNFDVRFDIITINESGKLEHHKSMLHQ